jgi:hypothetical protein
MNQNNGKNTAKTKGVDIPNGLRQCFLFWWFRFMTIPDYFKLLKIPRCIAAGNLHLQRKDIFYSLAYPDASLGECARKQIQW